MKRVAAVIFHAPCGDSLGERIVETARISSVVQLVARLKGSALERIIVASPEPVLPEPLRPSGIEHYQTLCAPFHFGQAAQEIIDHCGVEGMVYFGSGSGVLLPEDELARIVEFVRTSRTGAVFNNFYSCDFAGIADARRLAAIRLPATDNALGFALADAGIPCYALRRSASTQFDIDTPTDVQLLATSVSQSRLAADLAPALQGLPEHPHLRAALARLSQREATTYLVGRLSPLTWGHFEREVACRTGGLVEGRGMRSASTSHTAWLRQFIATEGPKAFFDRLERAADAAWIDSRPLLAETSTLPPPAERFASDMFRKEEISDPLWRAFTEAALQTSIPVVLGGHSLVSGGLYLAAQACWKARDLPRRLHPEPFEPQKERS